MSSGRKKGSVRGHCYWLQMSSGFSCVGFGQLYSLNFILVSHFYFEMFDFITDIFLLAVFFYLAFDIAFLA